MKIRKFFEADENVDISNDRVREIMEKITSCAQILDSKKEEMISLHNELSNYKSKSVKSNDQIDDSVANLELVNSKLKDILDHLDTVFNDLKDYDESGRKYLY